MDSSGGPASTVLTVLRSLFVAEFIVWLAVLLLLGVEALFSSRTWFTVVAVTTAVVTFAFVLRWRDRARERRWQSHSSELDGG